MLRLSPPGYFRFLQKPEFEACFGGSEANVAISLTDFGDEAEFVTKLPENDIADACVRELRSFGVGTENIARGGERMGIYFLEKGASLRSGKVIYDRAHSSVSEAEKADFNWKKILAGADVFHFTGITPALSDTLPGILLEAVRTAKELGVKVSCDLNYRSKLWSREKANAVMTKLMPYVDILIANDGSVYDVFGISPDIPLSENGSVSEKGFNALCGKLTEKFGFETVALTFRESMSASDNCFGGMLYKDGKGYFSASYPVHIVDRVGGGDGFAAGLLHGLFAFDDPGDAIAFAGAAGALKHTVEGDFNRVSVQEVLTAAKGNISGMVRR